MSEWLSFQAKVCPGVGLLGTFSSILRHSNSFRNLRCGFGTLKAASEGSRKEQGGDLGQGMVLACRV